MEEKYTFTDLLDIMRKLRRPDGCLWDGAQTHQSIKKHVVEEAYELVEAIDAQNPEKIADESGDLLLQVVFSMLQLPKKKERIILTMLLMLSAGR